MHIRFIVLAGEVNTNMPTLNTHKKVMNSSKILMIGLTYNPDVYDMRLSSTFKIFDLLIAKGAEIAYYDPFIPEIWETREHAHYTGMQTVEWNKETVSGFDVVLISINHSTIIYAELAEWSECIIDRGMRWQTLMLKMNPTYLRPKY